LLRYETGTGTPSLRRRGSLPHPRRDLVLFLAEGVGVDGRDLKGGVAHPLLEHVGRHPGPDGGNAVAVAQALGGPVRPLGDSCGVQYLFHPPLCRGPAPRPQGLFPRCASMAFSGTLKAVNHVDGIHHPLGDRNGPVNT